VGLVMAVGLTITAFGKAGAATTSTEASEPAGLRPPSIATMICRFEAIQDIASALRAKATVSAPTWADHLYTCRYSYPNGSMALSVKELSSWGKTNAWAIAGPSRTSDEVRSRQPMGPWWSARTGRSS
jgi:hypothetical protein